MRRAEVRDVPYEAVPTAASTPTPPGADPAVLPAQGNAAADGRTGGVPILRGDPGAEDPADPAKGGTNVDASLGGASLASDLEHDMRTWVDAQDYEPGEATADAVASIARDLASLEAQTDALAELPETERDAARQRIEARSAELGARIARIDEGWDL